MRKKPNLKKTTINLDCDVFNKLSELRERHGIFVGEVIEILTNKYSDCIEKEIILFLESKRGGNSKTFFRQESHQIIEKSIGRKLSPGEVVHHIDGNFKNNSIKNLKVFASQKEHMMKGHNIIYD